MPAKGAFSERYSALNRTSLWGEAAADAGAGAGAAAASAGRWQHGTLTTEGVAGAQPNPFRHERYTHKGPEHEQAGLAKVFREAGMQPR